MFHFMKMTLLTTSLDRGVGRPKGSKNKPKIPTITSGSSRVDIPERLTRILMELVKRIHITMELVRKIKG